MTIEWTGLGPELLLRLDRDGSETIGSQLQSQLREAIQSGRLAPGERLPSTRELAKELAVSRGLVVDSYSQLDAEGYLESSGGSATRVSQCAISPPPPVVETPAGRRFDVDFRYGRPDLDRFPMRDWLWALGEAAKDSPQLSLGNDDHCGALPAREVVAGYLRRVRASVVEAERVVLCNGFAQGAALVGTALRDFGIDTVALEHPRPLDIDAIFERAGLTVVSVPVDERGIDVDALAATKARAVFVTPAHQCPTGVVLAPERRQALVAWADATESFIVEDDYDAEFRYDRQPVGSMQGLAPCWVVGLGSVSKSLAPGLRLGWVVAPADLIDGVAAAKEVADRGSSGLDQLALSHLIRSGRYDRHLRKMRAVYSERRDALQDALATRAPTVKFTGLAAGMHAVIELPACADERAVAAVAAERGVGLYPMVDWRRDDCQSPPRLVVGFGSLTPAAITRGIATVADLLTNGAP